MTSTESLGISEGQPSPPSVAFDRSSEWTHLAQTVFGHAGLRDVQVKALKLITENDRALVTLPTGSGKSLLYGLLAISEPGLTLVVSPLTALKREQSQFFRAVGIVSAHLSYDQAREERDSIWQDVESGKMKLLFISPERFVSHAFVSRLLGRGGGRSDAPVRGAVPLARIFIDEAHCMASWGYDFRPEYRQIGQVLLQLGVPKVVALTATASPKTRELIQTILKPMSAVMLSPPIGPQVFVESVRVTSEAERELWMGRIVSAVRSGRKVIIYVQRRRDAEHYALRYRASGCRTVCYHAGLSGETRTEVEEYIRSCRDPMVIFATQAFGMGINLPEVDHVVVCGFPSGIEELLQMLGRAGRAGGAARGTLLWSGSDPVKRMHGIKSSLPFPTRLTGILEEWRQWLLGIRSHGFVSFSLPQLQGFLEKAQRVESLPAMPKVTERAAGKNRGRPKNSEAVWNVENFVHVLRMGEVVTGLKAGEPLLVFASQSRRRLLSLRDDLRGRDSQRLRVLEVICLAVSVADESADESAGDLPVFRGVPLFDVLAETRLSLNQMERVAAALSENSGIAAQIVVASEGHEARAQLLAAPWCLDVANVVRRYRELREERVKGFEALDGFARAESCRLKNVFTYLDGQRHESCGQCDHCRGMHEKDRKFETAAVESNVRKPLPFSLDAP